MNTFLNAYNPKFSRELFELCGTKAEAYLSHEVERPFVSTLNPGELRSTIRTLLSEHCESGQEMDRFDKILSFYLDQSANLHSPRYMGHQVPPPFAVAAAMDGMVGLLNQGLAVAEMSPAASAVERVLSEKLCERIGWDSQVSTGIATSGGTLANMTGILAARNRAWPEFWTKGCPSGVKPAIITSAESHYSVARAAGVLGLGTDQVIAVPLDEHRRLSAANVKKGLDEARTNGFHVFCLIASAPSTPIGAIDKLRELGELCEAEQLWYHVDAVHGAPFLFSRRLRSKLDGIELAHSVAWDAHKMMHVPSLCTFVLYRRKEDSFLAFENRASYLFDDNHQVDPLLDLGKRTFECTKRAITMPLMALWSVYGDQFFGELSETLYDNTLLFAELLRSQGDFEVPYDPHSNILVFRYLPIASSSLWTMERQNAFQKRLRMELINERKFYLTQAHVGTMDYLRVTIINPRTSKKDFLELIDSVRNLGQKTIGER